MEHFVDLILMVAIVAGALFFLAKTFKSAKSGCGSICSGCSSGCQTKIKGFKDKSVIAIKKID